jgi:hypothetical protein
MAASVLNANAGASPFNLYRLTSENWSGNTIGRTKLRIYGTGTGWVSGGGETKLLQIDDAAWNPSVGSASYSLVSLEQTINQTGSHTGNYSMLKIRATETSFVGDSALLIEAATNGAKKFAVTSTGDVGISGTASSKTSVADSTVQKVLVRDSVSATRWIELDSMRYAVTEYTQPSSNYQGRYKTGKIKFLIVSKKADNYTNTYHMMHLRSDSTNGVRLMGGRWSASGQNGYTVGSEPGSTAVLTGGWRQDWTGYIMAYYDYGVQSSYAPELQTFPGPSQTATKNYHRLPFKSGDHCYVPTFEIEVTYVMPSTSTSLMPAFFTND